MVRPLLALWLSSVVGCVALIGVDLDPTLRQPGAAGDEAGIDSNVTADGCVRNNCDFLGVACGSPADGCGGTLRCTDCANGCTPSSKAAACAGRCGAVEDGCGNNHDCGTAECGDASSTCFEGRCCQPTLECGDACGVTLARGCGLGTLECPGPAGGDTYVCHDGVRCQPATCGSTCGSTIPDGCGNSLDCPQPAPPAVCYQGQACVPQQCEDRCDGSVEPGCGLPPFICGAIPCKNNTCCVYNEEREYAVCTPKAKPSDACPLEL